jgi:hypothetical protein
MKKSRIIPLVALLLLVGIMASSLIVRRSAPPATTAAAAPAASSPTPAAAEPAAPPAISNAPPAATTTKAGAAPEKIQETPAPTLPAAAPAPEIVEMPATTPQPPAKFYAADMAAPHAATNQNYYFRFRAGYQHSSFGANNNDTFFLGAKFYAHGDQWRQDAGKNAWLVPDITAEISHQDLPKNQSGRSTGTTDGLQAGANFFWPWFNWAMNRCSHSNNYCPFSGPLAVALGPTANGGFDQLFNAGSEPSAFYHGGARLTLDRDAFIEYTVGGERDLPGTRQQLAAELPLYQSRDGQVRYVVRGLWDHVGGNHPGLLQGALLVEMPFDFLVKPSKWGDLVPFTK